MNPMSPIPPQKQANSSRAQGFALIIALTMMSFMVILVLSLATFLNVEMQTATHQNRMDEARANAILGAQIAIGQLQIHAGPDQRVTAPATVAYPEKTGPGEGELWDLYREHATGIPKRGQSAPTWKTYLAREELAASGDNHRGTWEEALDAWWETDLDPTQRKHPHWMGVWNSEEKATAADVVSDDSLREGDYLRNQTPRWLISGNENREPGDQFTPVSTFDQPDSPELVQLVGYGSASMLDPAPSSDFAKSIDGLDGAIYAPKVDIRDNEEILQGQYAYWVGDENTKANFALRDPFYEETDPNTKRYRNRMQVPQRLGWEQIEGFKDVFSTYPESEQDDMVNGEVLARIETTNQISLIDPDNAEDFNEASRQAFHHITGFSKGIFTDTARGGLQKDLTQFFHNGASATNGDLSENDPIPDPGGDDKLGYGDDARFSTSGSNLGFPNSDANIPTWGDLRDWYQNEVDETGDGEGAIEVTDETAPVVSQVRFFWGISNNSDKLRFHILPQIMMWNTYDVGLKNTKYRLVIKDFTVNLNKVQVASAYAADATRLPSDPAGTYPLQMRVYKRVTKAADATAGTPEEFEEFPFYFHELGNNSSAEFDDYDGQWADSRVISPVVQEGSVRDGAGYKFPAADVQIFADETDLVMEFETDFKAGEHLIFTVGGGHLIQRNSVGSNKEAVIQLENEFFDKDAPSAHIDFAQIKSGGFPNVHTYQTILIDGGSGDGNPWGGTRLFEDNAFNIQLYKGDELLRDFGKYGAGGITAGFNGIRAIRYIGDQPMSWRQLHSTFNFDDYIIGSDEVSSNAKNLLDPSQHKFSEGGLQYGVIEHSITTGGQIFTDPLYVRGSGTIASKREGPTTVWRPFANYNIMAKKFSDMNPLVDDIRHHGHWTNPAGVNRFSAVFGGSTSNSNQFKIYDFFRDEWIGKAWDGSSNSNIGERGLFWDAMPNQSHKIEEDGRIRSFSLLQRVSPPPGVSQNRSSRQVSLPLTKMPVRLAFRPEFDLISLGQLQQVNISPFMWQPANPIGNSEANTYVDRESITGLTGREIWAYYRRAADGTAQEDSDGNRTKSVTEAPLPNNVHNHLVDMSYLLNDALWDRYFLSTIPPTESIALDNSEPLDNSRIKFNTNKEFGLSDVRDYDGAANYLFNTGAFNVNSTSVEAWKALIMAFRDLQMDPSFDNDMNPEETVPIARTLNPLRGAVDFTFDASTNDPEEYGAVSGSNLSDFTKIYSGFRYLTDEMCQELAERIVDEVRLRGPFYSMSDFVNRRLQAPDGAGDTGSAWYRTVTGQTDTMPDSYDPLVGLHGINGALQRAINVSGINGGVNYPDVIDDNLKRFDSVFYPYQESDTGWTKWGHDLRWSIFPSHSYYIDSENKAGVPVGETGLLLSHSPGFLTQADVLSMLGPVLRPRGDTFLIRSYGSAISKLTGEVEAEAWLELTVQRVTDPLIDLDEDNEPDPGTAGRRFEIVNFRWLTEDEV